MFSKEYTLCVSTAYRGVLVDADFALSVESVQHAVVVQLATRQLLGDHVIVQHAQQQVRVRGQLLQQVGRKSLETEREEGKNVRLPCSGGPC